MSIDRVRTGKKEKCRLKEKRYAVTDASVGREIEREVFSYAQVGEGYAVPYASVQREKRRASLRILVEEGYAVTCTTIKREEEKERCRCLCTEQERKKEREGERKTRAFTYETR